MKIEFREATIEDAVFVSRGLHEALLMTDVSQEEIERFGQMVCTRSDVLHSPENTTIVLSDGIPAGILTAYDGSRYKDLRRVTMPLLAAYTGIDFSDMDDETEPGEYYLDSLAIMPEWRGKGLGTAMLQHAIAKGRALGLKVTLAVDPDNVNAQRLYKSLGFRHKQEIFIYGHTYWKWQLF